MAEGVGFAPGLRQKLRQYWQLDGNLERTRNYDILSNKDNGFNLFRETGGTPVKAVKVKT